MSDIEWSEKRDGRMFINYCRKHRCEERYRMKTYYYSRLFHSNHRCDYIKSPTQNRDLQKEIVTHGILDNRTRPIFTL